MPSREKAIPDLIRIPHFYHDVPGTRTCLLVHRILIDYHTAVHDTYLVLILRYLVHPCNFNRRSGSAGATLPIARQDTSCLFARMGRRCTW